MLVFFIHGVATRDVKYADTLKKSLRQAFNQAEVPVPHFCTSFWGNARSDIDMMWHRIDQDIEAIRREGLGSEVEDCFRYRQLREGLLSEFAGDMFVYLNSKRGIEIRRSLAQQLTQFLDDHPDETELHLITHSLGTVIFWDVFFSDRFDKDDPAHQIRALIRHLQPSAAEPQEQRRVELKSITTMGSPIVFFNMMLGVEPKRVEEFAARTVDQHLPWMNLIHPADIIAYPLKASLTAGELGALQIRDVYLSSNALTKMIATDATLLLEGVDAHVGYWNSARATQLIFDHLVGNGPLSQPDWSNLSFLQQAIHALQAVPGMTKNRFKLGIDDKPVKTLKFLDNSGTLSLIVNAAKVHHVYVFDPNNVCRFAGFVGWIHTKYLKDAIATIEETWC